MTVGEAWARERPLLRALPAERVRRVRDGSAAGGREVDGHDPPEPLLGPGRAWPGCGSRAGSAPGRSRSTTPAGRSPAMSGCTASSAPARSSTTTSSCSRASPARSQRSVALHQERERGALAGLLRRAVGRADRALRTLGRRPADGRRAAALPRARPRAGRARRPRRARRRRDRRSRGRGPRPPRRDRPASRRCSTGLTRRLAGASSGPRRTSTDYDQLLGGGRTMTAPTRRPRRWRR